VGLSQCEHFAGKERRSFFIDFVRTSFIDGPLSKTTSLNSSSASKVLSESTAPATDDSLNHNFSVNNVTKMTEYYCKSKLKDIFIIFFNCNRNNFTYFFFGYCFCLIMF